MRPFFCLAIVFFLNKLPAQDFVTLTELGVLDSLVHETSGLVMHYNISNGDYEVWTHNDADNTDSIYSFMLSDVKDITRIMDLGEPVKDWEDMTSDSQGNLYIGDFGSRASSDRQILKIEDPNTYGGNPPTVEKIRFEYPENGYTDMEGMIALGDSLYLFTKATDPMINGNLIEGMTYVFKLPNYPKPDGTPYVVEHAGQFSTKLPGDTETGFYRVTGADLSPDKKVLALLCYRRLWIFSGFTGSDFFSGRVEYVEFINNQKEGIHFLNNHEILISKEGKIGTGSIPKLFYLNIEEWIDDGYLDCVKINNPNFALGKLGWQLSLNSATATWDTLNEIANVTITNAGIMLWHIRLRQKGLVLENEKNYALSFKAWTSTNNQTARVSVENDSSTIDYLDQSISLTTSITDYIFPFTMATTDFNGRLTFRLGGSEVQTIFIDDVKLVDVACICPNERDFQVDLFNIQHYYQATALIKAKSKISGPLSDITFDAGQSISLDAGFEVSTGNNFKAVIGGCN